MKLSQSSAALYLSCQRKYKLRADKARPDADWRKPQALRFGAAFADCQEAFQGSWKAMTSARVIAIAEKHELDINAAAKLLCCLRAYFAGIPEGDVVKRAEVTLEHPVLSGRVDKLIERAGKTYIGEDKTASDINPALQTVLQTDPQLCLYAACRDQLEADGGVIYRVTTKPKEKRKKEEPWQEFTQRCKSEFFELVLPWSHFKIDEALGRINVVKAEIEAKSKLEEFSQNFRMCEQFGSGCEYYSQCHGKCFATANGAW